MRNLHRLSIKTGHENKDGAHVHHGSFATMTGLHNSIHDELVFVSSCYESDLDLGETLTFHVLTPNDGSDVELRASTVPSGTAKIEFFENGTVSDLGSELTGFNQNRTSTNTSTVVCYKDSTFTAATPGTRMVIKSAGGAGKFGGAPGSDDLLYWLLSPNEDYYILVTSKAADIQASISAQYHVNP